MVTRIIIIISIYMLFIFVYMRYLQKGYIYHPQTEIVLKPTDAGLRYEEVFFKTRDNLELNGWFIPAQDARGSLLFCHGNAGNISHRITMIEMFNKLKLDVFIFDYRGYGRSEGKPSEEGLYQDALAAYQYLRQREDINRDAIIIYGKSLGANIAIDLASEVKAAALIAESGFTSAYEMARRIFPYLPVRWLITVKYDAINKIKKIPIPKLIIHSKDDEIVPFRFGRRLFEAASPPKEFYSMHGTHNEAALTFKDNYLRAIDSFLTKYLPPF